MPTDKLYTLKFEFFVNGRVHLLDVHHGLFTNAYCVTLVSFMWNFLFQRITEKQNKVVITDRMWARLLSSTDQPSFLSARVASKAKAQKEPSTLSDGNNLKETKQ